MHDVIHAAIANQRVRELVETSDTRRAVRHRKVQRSEAAAPAEPVAPRVEPGVVTAALLRLRRGAMS
jgi:hypothetical protein